MSVIQQLLTDHIDIWTAADTEKKSGRGRASANAVNVYGIKKLRELILELAVRGKLVPQDANDQPASELLKRIQAEKAKIIVEGKIKKDKPLAVILDEEIPFELPHQWEWVRLGVIAEVIRGVTYGKSDASDNPLPDHVPLLRGNNINRVLNFDGLVFVPKHLLTEAQHVKAGDIVIAMSSGSADLVGKAAQATTDINGGFGAFCGVVRSVSAELLNYFGFFFQTPLYRNRAAGHGKGIGINNLQKTALQTLEIPLPPLAEQHRIVAKVDELMALCDQLETQHSNAAEAHEKLVSHLLGTLTQSQNAEDFSTNWQRISAHFDTLFTTEASIDALKQTLLQLAVMGKLVPQDPNDEPVVFRETGACSDKSTLTSSLAGQYLSDFKPPYVLPNSWKAANVGDVLITRQGIQIEKADQIFEPRAGYKRYLYISDFKHDEKLKFVRDEHPLKEVTVDDLIMANTAGPGEVFYGVPGILSNNLFKISFTPSQFCQNFLYIYFTSPGFIERVASELKGGAQQHLGHKLMGKQFIPIPPLPEQHRIVAKVDELMTLCDQIKSRIKQANQLQQKLADVLVDQSVTC